MINRIQNIANETQYNSNKERFVSSLYFNLRASGINAIIVNGKYIEVDNVNYHFVKNSRKGSYTVAIY